MQTEIDKFQKMTAAPIKKLITVLAIPTVLSMLVTAIYNAADTFFIGRIEGSTEEVTAAVGSAAIVFSLMAIVQACGFFFGQGSGTYLSRALGDKNRDAAEKMATFGFVSSFLFGAAITILGLIFAKPLARMLAATDTILPFAVRYMRFILIGAPFMCGSFTLNNQLRFQGNAFIAMAGIISGALINVGLDALFILGLGMDTDGAGLATLIGQVTGFTILFIGAHTGDNVRIDILKYRFDPAMFKEVFRGGLPSLLRQGLSSLAAISLNFTAKTFGGDVSIAAFGTASRVMGICYSAVLGFGQGFQPVCGYNYGAKKYDRVKEGFFFCLQIGTAFSVVVSAVIFIFARRIMGLFVADENVIFVGNRALRAQSAAFVFVPTVAYTNMLLQTIGKVFPASLLATARQGLFFLPVLFPLAFLFGVWGIVAAQPVADAMAFALAFIFAVREVKALTVLGLDGTDKLCRDSFAN